MKYISLVAFFILLFTGCSQKEELVVKTKPVNFQQIDGFYDDDLDKALMVFKKACKKSSRKKFFSYVCEKSNDYKDGEKFFTKYFEPKILYSDDSEEGLITGYYEPLLKGSLVKTEKYKYPIYKVPNDLIRLDKKSKYKDFKEYKYRAKNENGKLVPYDSREEISKRNDLEALCYVDDDIDLFFLHIQGSGRVKLENGDILNVGYASQNGRKYFAIGRELVDKNYVSKEDISMQSIRSFLEENPHKKNEIFNLNESYIFFRKAKQTATGSLGVPLVAKRNIAVDRRVIPLGLPVFIDTKSPITNKDIEKLVVAADTGGAIKGVVRADYFFGYGEKASKLAGKMKENGKLYVLIPKVF
ncbi:MAG: MltA domain-containing protein [Sulfurovum sp.]|mgnify:CR=1 FL=1|jgi:membrane-bound lytic murein transglycosylase A|nr:MAG: Membrane-bound lytic murein transglycosylase A [Arcobacter lacus]